MKPRLLQKALALTALSAFVATTAVSALAADGDRKKDHSRRAEVNRRLAKQNRRIHQEVTDGETSKPQAPNLHAGDHQIRQEERDMAKQEQRALNQQENAVSRRIGP